MKEACLRSFIFRVNSMVCYMYLAMIITLFSIALNTSQSHCQVKFAFTLFLSGLSSREKYLGFYPLLSQY